MAFGWAGDPTMPYVVLIDEIDKAPRDFPNDLLLELDQMRFTVDETQQRIGSPEQRPIIVITVAIPNGACPIRSCAAASSITSSSIPTP